MKTLKKKIWPEWGLNPQATDRKSLAYTNQLNLNTLQMVFIHYVCPILRIQISHIFMKSTILDCQYLPAFQVYAVFLCD